ncbi:MAG: hypothetical protein QOE89_1824 [Pseudonocardiales bacterium]|nr:hypothetical protein [Pseudonocardiales bacterium]
MVVDPVGCLGVGLVEVCLEVLSADAPLAAATDAGCGQMLSAHERVYLRSACVQDFSDIDESEQSGVHPQHRKSHAGAHAVIHTDDGQRTLAAADLVVTSKGADWLGRRSVGIGINWLAKESVDCAQPPRPPSRAQRPSELLDCDVDMDGRHVEPGDLLEVVIGGDPASVTHARYPVSADEDQHCCPSGLRTIARRRLRRYA